MLTEIFFDKSARAKMKAGMDKLANAVKVTLGPGGRNVCIRNDSHPDKPRITKDGVTVANQVHPVDKVENMGASIVRGAAQKTLDDAGDGTTTSTLLAQVIITKGLLALENKANPVNIKRGIDKAVAIVVEEIKKLSRPITPENMIQIATIAANNELEIGSLVADAITQTGKDGIIHIQSGLTTETRLELTQGIKLNVGYIDYHFVNRQEKMTVEFENPFILFADRKISKLEEVAHLLEFALAQKPQRPLLIIAEDVEGEVLSSMIATKMQRGAPFCAIRKPGFGNMKIPMFEDIAIMCGGIVVSEILGHAWPKVDHTYFGRADKVVITETLTTVIGAKGKTEIIEGRINEIRALAENSTNPVQKENQLFRLAKLTNGAAVIHVGGKTDIEIREKMDRIDDAKCATYAAMSEGVVPGGGTTYLRVIKYLPENFDDPDENIGLNIISKALFAPFMQIGMNAGQNESQLVHIVEKIADGDGFFGYNAKTNNCEDLFASGIIDPAKVARIALENAASVGALFLTTECSIVDHTPSK